MRLYEKQHSLVNCTASYQVQGIIMSLVMHIDTFWKSLTSKNTARCVLTHGKESCSPKRAVSQRGSREMLCKYTILSQHHELVAREMIGDGKNTQMR